MTVGVWRPYERSASRQLCWSHLERDLQAIIDGQRAGAEPATRAMAGADEMFVTWHRFGDARATPQPQAFASGAGAAEAGPLVRAL